jgi:hypothetical protein
MLPPKCNSYRLRNPFRQFRNKFLQFHDLLKSPYAQGRQLNDVTPPDIREGDLES